MSYMLIHVFGIYEDVVDEHNDETIQKWLEYSVHQVHKSCRCVSKSKMHYQKLVITITSPERHLRHIIITYPQLVISRSQVNLGEVRCSLKLIEQVVDAR